MEDFTAKRACDIGHYCANKSTLVIEPERSSRGATRVAKLTGGAILHARLAECPRSLCSTSHLLISYQHLICIFETGRAACHTEVLQLLHCYLGF